MKRFLIFLFFSLSVTAAETLHVGLSDVPPFSYKEQDVIKGINVDILKQVEKYSEQKFQYDLYPHARLSNLLESESPDLLIMFRINCDRYPSYESKKTFYTIYPLIVIKKSAENIDKANLRMARLIGTCKEVTSKYIKKDLVSDVSTMEQALEMLKHNRVDAICGMESVINFSKNKIKDFKEDLIIYKTQTETHDFDAVLCLKKSMPAELKKKIEEASKRVRVPEIK